MSFYAGGRSIHRPCAQGLVGTLGLPFFSWACGREGTLHTRSGWWRLGWGGGVPWHEKDRHASVSPSVGGVRAVILYMIMSEVRPGGWYGTPTLRLQGASFAARLAAILRPLVVRGRCHGCHGLRPCRHVEFRCCASGASCTRPCARWPSLTHNSG